MRFQLANEAQDMRTFCFISQGLHIPLGIHCMVTSPNHAVSTRYATVYIVTPFLLVRRRFFKSMSFAMITKPWMATELTKTVYTQGPGAHFCARVQELDLALGHRHHV